MKDRILTQEEWKKIVLDIVDEVDAFCRENDIRYALSYGSLLGAVRHGGFIPWDDDLDLSMPYPDMIRFKETFHSKNLQYCDLDTVKNYQFSFSRIAYKPTYNKVGLIAKDYGVNVDVYPVVGCPESDSEVEAFFEKIKEIGKTKKQFNVWRSRLVKYLPINTIPGCEAAVRKYRDCIFQYPFEGAKRYFHNGGPIKLYQVFDYDVFENLVDIEFEGHRYLAPAKYDDYLTHIYGDYMTPPPEDKRHPNHVQRYYWRRHSL